MDTHFGRPVASVAYPSFLTSAEQDMLSRYVARHVVDTHLEPWFLELIGIL